MGTITISGTDFEVLGTEAGARNYFKGRIGATAYDDATSADKKKAHVTASDYILAIGICDPDTGAELDATTTIANVLKGTYELLLAFLEDPTLAADARTGDNLKAAGAGSARVEFFGSTLGKAGEDFVLPVSAMRFLEPYLKKTNAGGASATGGTAFGTDGESRFCPDGTYGLSDFLP